MDKISKIGMVKEYIRHELEKGRLSYGKRLPSCRQLASELSVNKITVNKAYVQLEEEHQVYRIPRGGFYLVEKEIEGPKNNELYDFHTVRPDEKLVPYREFTHCLNKAVELHHNHIFGYEMSQGLPALRKTLKEIYGQEGIYTDEQNIIITNGAQQAIHLAFQTLFQDKKGSLLIEIPSYSLAIKLAKQLEIDIVGIKRTKEGYDYHELEDLLKSKDIKAFYMIPRHHNPTGYSLSDKVKKKIVHLCSQYNVTIIEDDYLADLSGKKGEMPLHYYDTSKRVFYIRSFSKTFIPGIRVGSLVVPTDRIEKVIEYKQLYDLHTSVLPQAALDLFMKSGMYEKHIQKVKKVYEKKLRKVRDILQSYRSDYIDYDVPERGIFIWLQIKKENLNKARFMERLKEQGIIIDFADECFIEISGKQNNLRSQEFKHFLTSNSKEQNLNSFIRICIAGIQEEDIKKLTLVINEINKK